MTNSEIKKCAPTDDQVIAFAISIYESQGYPPNSFEMLDYQLSNKFIKQAHHLIKCGYTRTPEPTKAENVITKEQLLAILPAKKHADHSTSDEMCLVGYGFNCAIDEIKKRIEEMFK